MQLRGVYLRAGTSSPTTTKIEGVTVVISDYDHVDLAIGGIAPEQARRIRTDLMSSRPRVNLTVGWHGPGNQPSPYSPGQQIMLFSCLDTDVVSGLLSRGVLKNPEVLYRYGLRMTGELERVFGRS